MREIRGTKPVSQAPIELVERAIQLLTTAPMPYFHIPSRAVIRPCVFAFCGVEYQGTMIEQPNYRSMNLPTSYRGEQIGFMRPEDLLRYTDKFLKLDLHQVDGVIPSKPRSFLERLVQAQTGGHHPNQSWTQYLQRVPVNSHVEMYARSKAVTAMLLPVLMPRTDRTDPPQLRMPIQCFGLLNIDMQQYGLGAILSTAASQRMDQLYRQKHDI